MTHQKQSPATRPWSCTLAPQTSQNLTSPRPPASPRTPNLRTQHRGERSAGSEGNSTRGSSEGGGPRDSASGDWSGSSSRSRGQRAPRPQARRAPAPRHPPASLAPAPDSCTDMKRGPRTPMKPAPANQRCAPPASAPHWLCPKLWPARLCDPLTSGPSPPAGPLSWQAPSQCRPRGPCGQRPTTTLIPKADSCGLSRGHCRILLTSGTSSQ